MYSRTYSLVNLSTSAIVSMKWARDLIIVSSNVCSPHASLRINNSQSVKPQIQFRPMSFYITNSFCFVDLLYSYIFLPYTRKTRRSDSKSLGVTRCYHHAAALYHLARLRVVFFLSVSFSSTETSLSRIGSSNEIFLSLYSNFE